MTRPNLVVSLAEAWYTDTRRLLNTLTAAAKDTLTPRPDTVEQARRDYAHAMRETGKWAA